MDFLETPDQAQLAGLVRSILEGRPGEPAEAEQSGTGGPRAVLEALGRADLLGLGVSETLGGTGAGLVEVCLALGELGKTLRPVPMMENLVLSAAPLAEFGSEALVTRWLPGLLAGSMVGTAALRSSAVQARPVSATPVGKGWRLQGEAGLVAWGAQSDVMLVEAPPVGGRGAVVLVVDAQSSGVTAEAQQTLGRSPTAQLSFDDVMVDVDSVLAGPDQGAYVAAWIADRQAVARCAVQLGICEKALRLTADYVQERKQFGKPIGDFQAVRQRLADAYIDTEAIRLTMLQAAWRLSASLPARAEIATARFWAADAGHRVVHSAIHLHGGVGIDEDYPLHRFFLAGMEIRSLLGATSDAALMVMAAQSEDAAVALRDHGQEPLTSTAGASTASPLGSAL